MKPTLEHLPIDKLVPNSWNAQKMDDAVFQRLVEEVKEGGCIVPLQVVPLNDGTYRIIGGEHRWRASQKAGLTEVPCAILSDKRWADTDLQKFQTVRLNAINGKIDPEKFLVLHREMADKYGKEAVQTLFGFTEQKGYQKLVGDMKKQMRKVLPKEMQAEFDEKAKNSKSAEDLGNIVTDMMNKYGETMGQSFMVFTYGKQEHVYVQADRVTKKAVDKLIFYCRETNADINTVLGPLLEQEAERRMNELNPRGAKKGKKGKKAEEEEAPPEEEAIEDDEPADNPLP